MEFIELLELLFPKSFFLFLILAWKKKFLMKVGKKLEDKWLGSVLILGNETNLY